MAKEASRSKDIEECYNRIPKSSYKRAKGTVSQTVAKRMGNDHKRSDKKSFFPNIENRLQLRINPPPKFTAIVTEHGNIKTCLHKFKIIETPKFPCNKGDQTVDHIIYSFKLQEQERYRLQAAITKSEQWPVSKNKLVLKYYDNFKRFTDHIVLGKE